MAAVSLQKVNKVYENGFRVVKETRQLHGSFGWSPRVVPPG